MFVPNTRPFRLEIETKESQVRMQETEYAGVFCRLGNLEVTEGTKAIFQRYVNGELTIRELSTAIDVYLNQKVGSPHTPEDESP